MSNPCAALAAKAATTTIPIVFGVAENPVRLGLVANLARPGGNATGIHFFLGEVEAKRLGLLHDLVPKAVRIAVLVNPANAPTAEATLRDIPEAARAIGLQIQVLNASTSPEIEAAFATIVHDRADALFVAPDAFFTSRRGQFATLAARNRMPTSCPNREMVEAGLLMSYGTNIVDMFRQVGIYTGSILKGAKPADLPVLQSTKFEFVINLQTARALSIDVPNSIQLLVLINRPLNAFYRKQLICLAAVPVRSIAMTREIHTRVDPFLPPAYRTESLSRKALAVLTNTQGVTCVLNGMRHPNYVDDSLGALRSPPFDVDAHLYEAFKHI
jgi:ABC-type uncharacterized transport system substrate-binding protein